MSSYLTGEQIAQLLKAINPLRVGKNAKGHSHVEAYEIRAHLNRLFGFARWSADVLDQRLGFEEAISCDACGHTGTVAEFADVGTLDAMLKRMTAAARLVH